MLYKSCVFITIHIYICIVYIISLGWSFLGICILGWSPSPKRNDGKWVWWLMVSLLASKCLKKAHGDWQSGWGNAEHPCFFLTDLSEEPMFLMSCWVKGPLFMFWVGLLWNLFRVWKWFGVLVLDFLYLAFATPIFCESPHTKILICKFSCQ